MDHYGLKATLGNYDDLVKGTLAQAAQEQVVARIWRKDAKLWKNEPEHQQIISNSLGWLEVPGEMLEVADDLIAFSREIRDAGFTAVMLCGMGGSSLCPEVFRQTFGKQDGYPQLFVLDSTDPDVLASLNNQIDVERCLFIIASKSGTTTEPLAFYRYWYDVVRRRKSNPGDSFVAITDPGTRMVEMAQADKFRRIFLNRSDIGGRYSALSYFGMVPGALMGVDIKKLLERAAEMFGGCSPEVPIHENPGAWLGAIIGECAKAGRDKLTLVAGSEIAALGLWIEQLVAESTGKEEKGILPVNGEPLGPPSVYGDDRVFVSIAVQGLDQGTASKLEALQAAGHPVIYRKLKDSYDLGEELFLWEFATAFAGWTLRINPFDQPNVQESKDATRELLEHFMREGTLPEQEVLVRDDDLSIYAAQDRNKTRLSSASLRDALKGHFARLKRGDYIALLAYFEEIPEIEAALQATRVYLRDATKCATTVGYGPRFLHSTGQLHKGGPDTGVFIQLTARDRVDLPIPGEPYTYSTLKQAQALGDFRALAQRGRRAIRVDLGADVIAGLGKLQKLIQQAVPL